MWGVQYQPNSVTVTVYLLDVLFCAYLQHDWSFLWTQFVLLSRWYRCTEIYGGNVSIEKVSFVEIPILAHRALHIFILQLLPVRTAIPMY